MPAQAFSYTISALESWTFSGIQVDVQFTGVGGIIDSAAGLGSVDYSADTAHVFASSSLVGPGEASILVPFVYSVTALEPGWSTVTFNYQLQEIGTVPVGGILDAQSYISAFSSGFGIDQFQQIQTTLPADQSLDIPRTITGSFTASAFFDSTGDSKYFEA